MIVRIEKVAAVENPSYPPGASLSYHHGCVNPNVSLPVGYWILGTLKEEPKVGSRMEVDRTVRNGVVAFGVFTTSAVVGIDGDRVWTINSVYRITRIDSDGWVVDSGGRCGNGSKIFGLNVKSTNCPGQGSARDFGVGRDQSQRR